MAIKQNSMDVLLTLVVPADTKTKLVSSIELICHACGVGAYYLSLNSRVCWSLLQCTLHTCHKWRTEELRTRT